jgi:hypothetical protein
LTTFLQGLTLAAFIALMFGFRAMIYPVIEAGGIPTALALIAVCFFIAERIQRHRDLNS